MIKEKKRVAISSICAAVFLTGSKLVIGLITGSLGIISEALHSGLDLLAATITYFSVRVSDKPADKEHHYGHGKIENLSALIQTILLIVTCAWVIYEAVSRLVSGNTDIEVNIWAYAVVITSIIVDISRSRALYRVAKKYNSQALEADALHFSSDIWSSAVVLVGLVCADFGFFFADSIAALVVSMIILFVSFRLGKKAIDVLIDKAPTGTNEIIIQTLESFNEIKKYHSLKIRTSGADTFIKVNIHLEPRLSLEEVHRTCDKIEKEIENKIPRCEIYLHPEPHNEDHNCNETTDELYFH